MVFKKLLLPLLFLLSLPLSGQADFYWEDEQVLVSDRARFPKMVATSEEMVGIWQEFDEEESTVSFYMITSTDGQTWTEPQLVTDPVNYFWEDQVSLFSLLTTDESEVYMAFPEDEQTIGIYKREPLESGFFRTGQVLSTATSLAPKIYEKDDGSLILFSTQSFTGGIVDGVYQESSLQVIYSEQSEKEGLWSEPQSLINDENLSWNFLPDYHSYNGREYVVFQSLFTGVRITWQLYIMSRDVGTLEWSVPVQITDREERYQNETYEYFYFDNQRPHLTSNQSGLILTWERHYSQLSPQIYRTNLDELGLPLGEFLSITDGFRYNAYPRSFEYGGEDYILWFDNRDGNQVIFSSVKTALRGGERLSKLRGNSSYGIPIIFKDDLFVFWENSYNEQNRFVMLSPDKSVDQPRITPISFTLGQRNHKSLMTLNWIAPDDSSGIEGYLMGWDRDPFTDPSLNEGRLLLKPRATTYTASDDGVWYFHISVRDNAGNWSNPLHVPYYRDTTPPASVYFERAQTDPYGALLSNSPILAWFPSRAEDLAGYTYSLTFMGSQPLAIDDSEFPEPPARVMTTDRAIELSNRDNGYWALAVRAVDNTGNMGESAILRFYMNKYIPRTYISWVSSSKNREESIVLDIRGRGFSQDGQITQVIVDKDGQAPWDYEYFLNQDYSVSTDRRVTGPVIDDMKEGIYYIGVVHPRRGLVFASNKIKLDSTGNVKFGDFTQEFTMGWILIKDKALRLALNKVAFYLLAVFLLAVIVFLSLRVINLWQENSVLQINARALLEGTKVASDLEEEKVSIMKRQGVGLRAKFTFAFLGLVASIVLLVALVLGSFMITTQQISLGEELEKRSQMMVATLASGAENYLPFDNRIELSLLPKQIDAMDEALSTTITGKGAADPQVYNYLWSSNREDVNSYQVLPDKISSTDFNRIISLLTEEEVELFSLFYLEEQGSYLFNQELKERSYQCGDLLFKTEFIKPFSAGSTLFYDSVDPMLRAVESEINSLAASRIADMVRDYDQLNSEGTALVLRRDAASRAKLAEIQETTALLAREIDDALTEITQSIGVQSEPVFNPEELLLLGPEERVYTFYKPIVYQEKGSNTYYKGAVRLEVSMDPLIKQILGTRKNIIYITVLTFLVAIAASIVLAILLASTLIKPIRELASHVKTIRDTEDKSTLKDQMLKIKSKDELGDLGEIINQMTYQLAKAADASKELTVGKDMQKAFIPLEEVELGSTKRKLTTGFLEDGDLTFFGYYEGAKGVSGDYFDYRKLDDDHYAVIKCDIAGKGVSASLIMVEVATIFVSHCRDMEPSKGINLPPLLYNINDLLLEVGFQGRFAAFSMMIINKHTGDCVLTHAGDMYFHYYDGTKRDMEVIKLNEAPAAGQIDTFLVEMKNGYTQKNHNLKKGDIMFMFTDGLEEAQRLFRNGNFDHIDCDGSCPEAIRDEDGDQYTHIVANGFEEFSIYRMKKIITQIMNKGEYELIKYHHPRKEDKFEFDFSTCQGEVEVAVTGLVAVEKVYRLFPYDQATNDDVITVDKKIDSFLREHFVQYRDYFKNPEENANFPEYVYFRHLKEDEQFDDLTILAVERK